MDSTSIQTAKKIYAMILKKRWSIEEELFLKDNYPKMGLNFCVDKLNRSKISIQKKRKELGLYFLENNHNFWKDEEVSFLVSNYPTMGLKYCCGILNRSKLSVQRKIEYLKLKKINVKYSEENIIKIVSESKNYSEVTRKLGLSTRCGNRQTIKRYIKKYNIDISHFDFGGSTIIYKNTREYSLEEILIRNSPYVSITGLKIKLFKYKLKESICEECGQCDAWRGKKMGMILDHINGINDDNRLENLRILCPNCNSITETFCKGNIDNYNKMINKKKEINDNKKLCGCGNKKDRSSIRCSDCFSKISKRKTDRPDYETLIKQIHETNYCAVGRLYGVSDNCIRNWIKDYEKSASQAMVAKWIPNP